jgi:hypothetical protein
VRVEESRSALQSYREQADALAPRDALGWARLARWAADHDLATPAREAWEHVLDLDPGHPEANAALGRRLVNGQWMAEDDALRAQGYVPYDGRWVTPAEHEALVQERVADEQAQRDRAEADLRVREAEARAREAEARAREAEAAVANPAEGEQNGIPYGWIFGGGGGLLVPPVARGPWTGSGLRPDGPRRERPGSPSAQPPAPTPTPAPNRAASRSGPPAAASHAAVPAPPGPPRTRRN